MGRIVSFRVILRFLAMCANVWFIDMTMMHYGNFTDTTEKIINTRGICPAGPTLKRSFDFEAPFWSPVKPVQINRNIHTRHLHVNVPLIGRLGQIKTNPVVEIRDPSFMDNRLL
jgi:hypothetical protein